MKDTITYKDIMKVSDEIMEYAPKRQDNPFAYKPMHYADMPIYAASDRIEPKMQVSEWFADKWLTDEAKERINAKLVEMLGVRIIMTIPENTMYMFGSSIIARREDITRLLDISA